MDDHESKLDDLILGLEVNLLSQEQVISVFRELVAKDLGMATLHYMEFANKLEEASSGGDAQARNLVGGPDSAARAQLVEILAGKYETASDEVKLQILDLALAPLMRDNSFYVQMTVARMRNPYVVADIMRKVPMFGPGANYYSDDIHRGDHLSSGANMRAWLERLWFSFFAATTLALEKDHAFEVSSIIEENPLLFEGAAHIIASHRQFVAEWLIEHPDKTWFLHSFVDEFEALIAKKTEEANWLSVAAIKQAEESY